MYKFTLLIIAVFLAACSPSYEEHLADHKTRLPYTNIELRLPKMLTERSLLRHGGYTSKDGKLGLMCTAFGRGYAKRKGQAFAGFTQEPNEIRAVVPSRATPNIASYELYYRVKDTVSGIATYVKKFDADGALSCSFVLNEEDVAARKRLSGIALASFGTISHVRVPVDLTEGLGHKLSDSDALYIVRRSARETVYQRADWGRFRVRVYHMPPADADNGFPRPYQNYLSYPLWPPHKNDDGHDNLGCQKIRTERAKKIEISGRPGEQTLRVQECRAGGQRSGTDVHEALVTEVDAGDRGLFTIGLVRSRYVDESGPNLFDVSFDIYEKPYNEFLEKLTIP